MLYETFPKPITLDVAKFRRDAGLPENSNADDSDEIGDVVNWLKDEEFINHSGEGGWGQLFTKVVLTAKGLAALNRVPDSLEPQITVGARLKELSRTASSEVVNVLVQTAIGFAASRGS